ncbi:site-specific integrase [Acidithiobacillus montserratensis]|uniref:Site-specific integrase n=1 Tax=Acidithiobacillus montserratensis TaxID=2729135 RepID=A0ACD5HIS5_9PROT|nr:site-specific integrase [Acidithiobacillus montserratensis]MBN2680510.1 site-specific integrase [Acidithiobacillaceae bacterium]MBU2746936.1 site-specific integrase [Acidithiobacillus montserratensis]
MATIRSREDQDGITIGWQAQIKRKGFPLQVKTFRSKAEATQWATVTESEMLRGVFVQRTESEQTTLKELLDRYSREVLPTLKGGYREQSRIKALQVGLGTYSLAALNSSMIAKYRDKRLSTISEKTGRLVSAQTVKHELGLLQRALKMATMEWGIALPGGIPTVMVKQPSLPSARDRRLIDDEEARLLAECANSKNLWLRPAVILAIETAMRAGEILESFGTADTTTGVRPQKTLGLQWADVDLKKRTAHLPKTKNGDARTVPLSTRAVATLEALPRSMDGKVFGTTYEGIHQAFVRACKRAGIEGLTFHDLRHEATSRLFEKGLNPMQVAAITGHKTLQMLKRYTHLRAEDLAKLLG